MEFSCNDCGCEGQLKADAPPICPDCGSGRVSLGENPEMWVLTCFKDDSTTYTVTSRLRILSGGIKDMPLYSEVHNCSAGPELFDRMQDRCIQVTKDTIRVLRALGAVRGQVEIHHTLITHNHTRYLA